MSGHQRKAVQPWCQRSAHLATEAEVREQGLDRGRCNSRTLPVRDGVAFLTASGDGAEPTIELWDTPVSLTTDEAMKLAKALLRLVEIDSKASASTVPAPRVARSRRTTQD